MRFKTDEPCWPKPTLMSCAGDEGALCFFRRPPVPLPTGRSARVIAGAVQQFWYAQAVISGFVRSYVSVIDEGGQGEMLARSICGYGMLLI
jgi:hypothetical protein